MQKITKILMVDGSAGTWTDEFGKKDPTPEIVIGVQAVLRFDLRQLMADPETGIIKPVNLDDFRSDGYYLALDSDYLQETDPRLLKNTGISLVEDDGLIYLEAQLPNTAVPGLLEAVGSGASVPLKGEIGGFSGDGNSASADFAVQFPLIIRNRVYLGGEIPEYVQNDPEYLKAHEVIALIEQATRPEKGDPGLSAYQLAVQQGYTGSLAEWLESLRGAVGAGLSAYLLAVQQGYTGSLAEWLESLNGEDGGDGKSAYQLAVEHGYTGSEGEWLESLHGAPGQDLKLDAAGELSERGAYDDRPAGFIFGATETNYEERWSKLYIYIKKSDEYNDWCTPIVITFFKGRDGRDGENVALIKPLEFEAPDPEKNFEYLSFSLKDFPAVDISGVYIDTADGEYRLPYDSARGILKITKDTAGTVKIYFGSLCPEFETGRIYFAQGSSGLTQYQWYLQGGGTLPFDAWVNQFKEAPVDGRYYARCNGQWVDITDFLADPGEPPEPPPETMMYYGYVPYPVAGDITAVTQLTKAMLEHEGSSVIAVSPAILNKVSLGVVPAGAWVIVALPATANMTASKFNGIDGKASFSENNGGPGTGANGATVELGGVSYKIYGEFKLNAAEIFVYVDNNS